MLPLLYLVKDLNNIVHGYLYTISNKYKKSYVGTDINDIPYPVPTNCTKIINYGISNYIADFVHYNDTYSFYT